MQGYKLVSKRVPKVHTVKKGSQIVKYAMINEDLASTLGVTQIQMQSRLGGPRPLITNPGDPQGNSIYISIIKDYEDHLRLKFGGVIPDPYNGKGSKSNLSPKQKVGMAMQKLEKLMRMKNQKLSTNGLEEPQFVVRKTSVDSKRNSHQTEK